MTGLVLVALAGAAALAPALAVAQSCPLGPLVACDPSGPPAPPRAGGDGATEEAPPAAGSAKVPPPLAIGLTESDPRLLVPGGTAGRAARMVVALRPEYVRVLVPWERLQPRAGRKPNWDAPPGGCPRMNPNCRSDHSLRDLLRAIRYRQQADGGWKVLVVPYFTPSWAASRFTGCQRARSRHPRAQLPRITSYRRFLRRLNALADKVGIRLDYVTPWNEPNHPAFLQPQRATCDRLAPAVSPRAYATLVRAAQQELRPAQTLVLGSLAGLQPEVYGAGAAEFIRGLPRDVACAEGPFAQHAYVGWRARRGQPLRRASPASAARRGLLDGVLAALDAQGCAQTKRLWIAETGTFDHRCEGMAAALHAWAHDDRIDAAFQFTFREAHAFPVGLVSPSLTRTYRSHRAWFAFAGGPPQVPPSPC